MFTVEDLTNRYGVTEHTVLSWIHSGQLKAVNVGRTLAGKKPRWRVTEQALADFEALRTSTPEVTRTKRRKRSAGIIEFYK